MKYRENQTESDGQSKHSTVLDRPQLGCRVRVPGGLRVRGLWHWCLLVGPTLSVAAEAPVTELAPIVVTTTPLARQSTDQPGSVLVLEGQALTWRQQPTLGETLDGEPGIHADSFGAGASRPVIRGQQAPRVTVLAGGAPLQDASAVSPDHAIDVETGLARRIEVIRGPATLLYGGGAIGGVVNVVDGKIPETMPAEGVELDVGGRLNIGSRLREGAFGLTTGSGSFALRVEGLARRSDDYRVPRQAASREPDTYSEARMGSVGASWVTAKGYLGLGVTDQRRRYGLPGHSHAHTDCHPHGQHLHCEPHDAHTARLVPMRLDEASLHDRHGHDDHGDPIYHDDTYQHGHEAEGHDAPWIDQRSRRWDWRTEYSDPLPGFERIRALGGWTDYRHDEIEEGTSLSRFSNRGYDGRVELDHVALAGWRGTLGASWMRSDFDVTGPEAFMPRSVTKNRALFLVETYQYQDWQFELGVRQEWQQVAPTSSEPAWRGHATSASAGAVWHYASGYSLSSSVSRSQRMPNAQELYADGVHLATNTFELGNAGLSAETGFNWELKWRKTSGVTQFEITAYQQRIKNYIYAHTLDDVDGFRLIRYQQREARFTGAEGRLWQRLTPIWSAVLSGDVVHARFAGGDNVPRIPAARVGAGLRAQWRGWDGRLDFYRVFAQRDNATYESSTPGYNLLNAGISYRWREAGVQFELALIGRNLLNELAYEHASFLANTVPLPGRNVTLSLQARY